jgi:hypothetical protein
LTASLDVPGRPRINYGHDSRLDLDDFDDLNLHLGLDSGVIIKNNPLP